MNERIIPNAMTASALERSNYRAARSRGRTLSILMAAPFGAGKSPGDDFAARSEYVEVVRPLPHHGMPLLVELGNPIARLAQGKRLSQDAG